MYRLLSRFSAAVLVACGLLSGTATAASNETRIDSASYDVQSGTIVVAGVRFADKNPPTGIKPYVEFGGVNVSSQITSWTTGEIVLQLSAPLTEGEHQIYVERKTFNGQVPHGPTATNLRAHYSLTVKDYAAITASAGPLSGYQIVESTVAVPAADSTGGTGALCPIGKVVIGGGARLFVGVPYATAGSPALFTSAPGIHFSGAYQWTANARETTAGGTAGWQITAVAICAFAQP